jgi:hypothetical protein
MQYETAEWNTARLKRRWKQEYCSLILPIIFPAHSRAIFFKSYSRFVHRPTEKNPSLFSSRVPLPLASCTGATSPASSGVGPDPVRYSSLSGLVCQCQASLSPEQAYNWRISSSLLHHRWLRLTMARPPAAMNDHSRGPGLGAAGRTPSRSRRPLRDSESSTGQFRPRRSGPAFTVRDRDGTVTDRAIPAHGPWDPV